MAPTRSTPRELSGDLSLLSLFDLCQTLGMNGATGTLRLESERGKGYLYFQKGQLINGLDERQREGERPARSLFQWTEATFQFQSGPISVGRVIEDHTQGLLLDIARELDEAAGQAGEGDSNVEKLKAHDSLRAAFARISDEDRRPTAGSTLAQSPELVEQLAAVPGAEMLLRPDHPVLVRQDAGWNRLGREPLSPTEFDELLRSMSPPGQLLASGQGALPRSASGAPFRVMFGEDVRGPFLLVRALHSRAPDPALLRLPGGLDWETLLRGPRVEVSGARGSGKSYFLAAAARAACELGLTVAWGSPEPAARLANLDLPLQYLPGALLNPDLFLELAIGLRASVVIWDGPVSVLPGLTQLPEWGTSVFSAGEGLRPPSQRLETRLEAGRVLLRLCD